MVNITPDSQIGNSDEYSEYEDAIKLKKKLLETYDGMSVNDLNGEEFSTEFGPCYNIENRSKIKLNTLSVDKAKSKILSDLKLLSGIGEAREQKLRADGYCTIEDLCDHDKFSREARELLNIVHSCDTCNTSDWISNWYPKSHPLNLFSSSFNDEEDFIFLDIETLGFFNRPIILLGVAKISGKEIQVNQYLSRSLEEENAVLASFLNHVESESVYVTFNGQTFDMPFIANRMRHHGVRKDIDKPHFDLLHFSRRAWSEKLPNCKLTTIEKHLFGIEREDDIPSGLVPEFYKVYAKSQNIGPLVPIIEHNRQDIVTLAKIFSKLHEEWE